MKMKNKIVLVTGGAVGYKEGGESIGSAIAFKLALEGAKVVIVDLLTQMGQRTADIITKNGGEAIFVKADVSNSDEVQTAVSAAKDCFGGLHSLVNCAATYEGDIFHTVVDTPEEDWMKIFNVNLHGYYRFAKYSIPLILESGGGSIINISSIAAYKVVPNFAVYHVTKAAINGLTRVLAIDHAPKVRTNAICPGFVKIANSEGNRSPEALRKWHESIAETYPGQRLCSVEEIANIACFLSSNESSYINGECIRADGGKSVSDFFEYKKN
jgi:NAD(P)-dependent dehydrogenase (short-subunit alcohol dehydrogenase family)